MDVSPFAARLKQLAAKNDQTTGSTPRGPRLPDVDHAQKHFNTGVTIVLRHGDQPPPQLLRDVDGIRLRRVDYWTTVTGPRSTTATDPR